MIICLTMEHISDTIPKQEEKIMMVFEGSNAILTILMITSIIGMAIVLYKGFRIMANEVK